MSTRYYNPEWGRFINADAFTSTGQGLLGNNMFAYCNNNPVINRDNNGTWTISIGYGISGTCVVGASISKSFTVDKNGISYQHSKSSPKKRETTTIGLLSAGYAFAFQVTNKDHAGELEGVSTYLGFAVGKTGIDVVSDKPVANTDGKLTGVQVSIGVVGAGVDVHVAQTDTVTTGFISWRNLWKKIIS